MGNKHKEIWTTDKKQQLESFQKDLIKNSKTCHNNISCTTILIIWMET